MKLNQTSGFAPLTNVACVAATTLWCLRADVQPRAFADSSESRIDALCNFDEQIEKTMSPTGNVRYNQHIHI